MWKQGSKGRQENRIQHSLKVLPTSLESLDDQPLPVFWYKYHILKFQNNQSTETKVRAV